MKDCPDLDQPLSHYFSISSVDAALYGVPILGLPGSIDAVRRRVLRGAPYYELAAHLAHFKKEIAFGGISHVRILRSPHWRTKGRMLVLACDVGHITRDYRLCTLPWWSDEECEMWVMQAFA